MFEKTGKVVLGTLTLSLFDLINSELFLFESVWLYSRTSPMANIIR